MKQIAHIDKKWQSSVTAYVEVTYDDGSHKYYLAGRYGGGPLTAEALLLPKLISLMLGKDTDIWQVDWESR